MNVPDGSGDSDTSSRQGIVTEVSRTVREALESWPRTARLCGLLTVAAVAVAMLRNFA